MWYSFGLAVYYMVLSLSLLAVFVNHSAVYSIVLRRRVLIVSSLIVLLDHQLCISTIIFIKLY